MTHSHTEPATHDVIAGLSWTHLQLLATTGWLLLSATAALPLWTSALPLWSGPAALAAFALMTVLTTTAVVCSTRLRTAWKHGTTSVYLRLLTQPAVPGFIFAVFLLGDDVPRTTVTEWTTLTCGLYPSLPAVLAAWYAYRQTVLIQLGRRRAPTLATQFLLHGAATASWYGTWTLLALPFLNP